jgi:hypothetical protein
VEELRSQLVCRLGESAQQHRDAARVQELLQDLWHGAEVALSTSRHASPERECCHGVAEYYVSVFWGFFCAWRLHERTRGVRA